MARKRVVEAPSLHSWEDVNDALRQIAEAQIALGEIQSDMQKQILGAQKVAEEQSKPLNDNVAKLEREIKSFVTDHRDEMGKTKSVVLTFGEVGFRLSTSDWGDVDLKIPGLNIQVQEISYDDELEIEEVYGYGSKPRGYGTGNYKASGKLSMLRDDYDDLLAYCKQKGVPFYKMELPSIIVSYANEGARTKIDELKKVKFSKRSNKAAQGDKSLTVDVDMMIVGGVYQDGVAPV